MSERNVLITAPRYPFVIVPRYGPHNWLENEEIVRLEEQVESHFTQVLNQDTRMTKLKRCSRALSENPLSWFQLPYGESSLQHNLVRAKELALESFDRNLKDKGVDCQAWTTFCSVIESLVLEHVHSAMSDHPEWATQFANITSETWFLTFVVRCLLGIVEDTLSQPDTAVTV